LNQPVDELPTLLEFVRPSVRPVEWAHIVSPSAVMNADAHRGRQEPFIACIAPIANRRPVRPSLSSERRAPVAARGSETGSFSSTRTKFVFISVARNTGYKFSGINDDAIFGPRIAAETCGKKDGVNSSACQDVTRRRSTRPE
jgi:hypothetical protein